MSELFARNLGCLYEAADNNGLLERMSRVTYAVTKPNIGQLPKPFVSVQCRAYPNHQCKNMQYPHNNLFIPPLDEFAAERSSVPESIWTPLVDSPNAIKASWVDFSAQSPKPSVGLVVFARNGIPTLSSYEPAIASCAVDPRWVPVTTCHDLD